jgi:hypothetical protein
MTDTVTRTLVEQIVDGKRLGRHVEHDPRSRGYAYKAAEDVALRNIVHRHYGGILDQGNLGSCTGNACAGAINTIPIHAKREHVLREPEALDLYELATAIDEFPGQYPPEDTGSSGLAVAKAAQQKGYISSYQHAFSIGDALLALMEGPIIVGVNWYEGFDTRTLTASSRSRARCVAVTSSSYADSTSTSASATACSLLTTRGVRATVRARPIPLHSVNPQPSPERGRRRHHSGPIMAQVGRPRVTTRQGVRAPTTELGVPDLGLGGWGVVGSAVPTSGSQRWSMAHVRGRMGVRPRVALASERPTHGPDEDGLAAGRPHHRRHVGYLSAAVRHRPQRSTPVVGEGDLARTSICPSSGRTISQLVG